MPRPISSDLAPFQRWLVKSYSISNKSASVYTSKIRKILKDLEEITEHSLNVFISRPENQASRDLFLTAWNRFQDYMLEESKILLPKMARPKISKNQRKIKISRPLLELANYLKTVTKMTYSKMLTLSWNDVKPMQGDSWEIIDPVEYGTIYRVPSALFCKVCDWSFGDEAIKPENPIFSSFPGVRSKISRSQLSLALKDFIPLYEQGKREPMQKPTSHVIKVEEPEQVEIKIESDVDLPDFVSEYEMFDPDKI